MSSPDGENLGRSNPEPYEAICKTPRTYSVGRFESGNTLLSTTIPSTGLSIITPAVSSFISLTSYFSSTIGSTLALEEDFVAVDFADFLALAAIIRLDSLKKV